MKLEVARFTDEHIEQVREFNGRLKAGGSAFSFPETPVAPWLPALPGRKIYQEHFVVLDESKTVRGGYILKHQDFWLKGQSVRVTDVQLPISEGTVDARFNSVGVFAIKHASKQAEFLYGLGMGGTHTPVARTFQALGWRVELVPFYFRVLRPFGFLRNIRVVRKSRLRVIALDLAAFTGLGWLGFKAAHLFMSGPRLRGEARVETFKEFGAWSDAIWDSAQSGFDLSAVRDAETLNILYPESAQKFIKLRVRQRDEDLGWAVVLCTQMENHTQFGAMRVGSLVDCCARPGFESDVVAAAARELSSRRADIAVSNQASPVWQRALERSGFIKGPSNFALALSRKTHQTLESKSFAELNLHINRGDGDGPINL